MLKNSVIDTNLSLGFGGKKNGSKWAVRGSRGWGGGGRAGIGLFSFPIQIAVFCTTTILLLVVAVKEINAAI